MHNVFFNGKLNLDKPDTFRLFLIREWVWGFVYLFFLDRNRREAKRKWLLSFVLPLTTWAQSPAISDASSIWF